MNEYWLNLWLIKRKKERKKEGKRIRKKNEYRDTKKLMKTVKIFGKLK